MTAMKTPKTDFENLHVGHRIYVFNREEMTECIEKVKAKGFGTSIGTDLMGNYVKVEEKGYNIETAHEGERKAYGLIMYCSLFMANKKIEFIKEQKGFVGVIPSNNGIVCIFDTENDMKVAFNLIKAKGWKANKIGAAYIPKEF